MPKLLILSNDANEYRDLIEKENFPNLEFALEPTTDCDIVLGAPNLIRAALDALPNLKWAQSTWAGVEPLLDISLRRDYILTNARGVFGGLMSEFVFGHLLFHEKQIGFHQQAQKEKRWAHADIGMLRGKTIGLLGVGSIGAHLAQTAKFFGMTVCGYTRASETSEHVDAYYHGDQLLEFVRGLDYLVCILPRTQDTNKIVDANLLKALPPRAIFVNVGRGNAVDESALVDALTQKKIAAAVLDVFEKEPLPEDHPFWTTPNLRMTFHTSALSYPADIAKVFIENYLLYVEGKPLKYRVDFARGY
ncbi:MAG: D-2-hydroxyacid dehydrogenase [Anaerolineales bacterium]|nr:D-2-hydroxyacid dehydrogenase [Anaerolineales bacterium]